MVQHLIEGWSPPEVVDLFDRWVDAEHEREERRRA